VNRERVALLTPLRIIHISLFERSQAALILPFFAHPYNYNYFLDAGMQRIFVLLISPFWLASPISFVLSLS
jgi:hypothetical protein